MFKDRNSVQPLFVYKANDDGGQGGDGGSDGLFDLSSVPEDYRPYVEPHLKDIQKNVNKKFEEAANYRKQWEPYEELGVNNYEPESLQGLLQFAEIANDPNTFKEWWQNIGQENGYLDEYQQGPGDEGGDFGDDEGIDLDTLKDTFSQMLDERLSPITQKNAEFEEAQRISQAEQFIDEQIAELEEQHGKFDTDTVYKLALAYDGPEAIKKGFEDYQNIISSAERDTVNRGANGPGTPEGPGPANTNAEPITSFEEADKAARERMSQLSRQ